MRLIDADLLDNEIMNLFIFITGNPKQSTVVNECKSTFRRIIDEQPTAYDQEEVVKQLKALAKFHYERKDMGELAGLHEAIEIVRNGVQK